LSDIFASRAVAQILDFFVDHREFDDSPSEIAQITKLSFRTVFREIPNLEENQLIYHSIKIGKTNMYRLNTDFQAVMLLEKFVLQMIQMRQVGNTQSQTGTKPIAIKKKLLLFLEENPRLYTIAARIPRG
jgi:hypothetical protein